MLPDITETITSPHRGAAAREHLTVHTIRDRGGGTKNFVTIDFSVAETYKEWRRPLDYNVTIAGTSSTGRITSGKRRGRKGAEKKNNAQYNLFRIRWLEGVEKTSRLMVCKQYSVPL